MLAALAMAVIASAAAAQPARDPARIPGWRPVNAGEPAHPQARLQCRRYFGCLSADQLRPRTDIRKEPQ